MTFESLDHPIRWLFLAHALCGAVALLIFLIPLFSKKGGKLHVWTGWIYISAMTFVSLSTFVLSPWRIFFDPERSPASIAFSIFLFYIAIFTLTAIWFGLSVLKEKKRIVKSRRLLHIGPPLFMLVFGFAVQGIGLKYNNTLLMAFPFIGHVVARSQLKYWLQKPEGKMHWWYAHMRGMFTSCIATITAFLVTALPRLIPQPWTHSAVLWMTPGLVLGVVLARWISNYRIKFGETSV
jgi:uncharacterized membrane protein